MTNLLEVTSILAGAGGAIVAGVLVDNWSWRVVFIGTVPVLLLGIPARFPAAAPLRGKQSSLSGSAAATTIARLDSRLAPVYAASFAVAFAWSGLVPTLAPMLGHGQYGLTAAAIGTALAAEHMANLVGLGVVSLMIDRWRREPIFLGGTLFVAVGELIIAVGSQPVAFWVGLVLMGCGFAMFMIPAVVLADRAGTPLPARCLAFYRIAMDLGAPGGPLVLSGLTTVGGAGLAVGACAVGLVGSGIALVRRQRSA